MRWVICNRQPIKVRGERGRRVKGRGLRGRGEGGSDGGRVPRETERIKGEERVGEEAE